VDFLRSQSHFRSDITTMAGEAVTNLPLRGKVVPRKGDVVATRQQ
jgi:hypothetical protein